MHSLNYKNRLQLTTETHGRPFLLKLKMATNFYKTLTPRAPRQIPKDTPVPAINFENTGIKTHKKHTPKQDILYFFNYSQFNTKQIWPPSILKYGFPLSPKFNLQLRHFN